MKRTFKEIARGNDLIRTTMIKTSNTRVVLTNGVSLSPDREKVLDAVRAFKGFDANNDPNGEHDFGRVRVNGTDYFWKIDYYDLNWEYGADPYNDDEFCRLLTIMLASEY